MTDLGNKVPDNTAVEGHVLYKHIATIHKSNNLTLLQNKISNVLYFNAYKDLKTHGVHKISIGELCKQLSYKSHNDYEIKKALKGLISAVVEWNLFSDDKLESEDWTASTMLASAKIKKGGICEYSYSFHMRELLSDPVLYGVINMVYQANFRSKYGLALYENCARFVNIGQTGWLDIDFFRELMGVPKSNYQIFRDFKRRVLDVAVNEVNAYSNLNIEPLLKKTGRKVTSIKFKISRREKKKRIALSDNDDTKNFNHTPSEDKELASILRRDFLFTERQTKKCFSQYSEEYIREKINYVNSNKTKINNISAYLLSALKNDYQKGCSYDQIRRRNLDIAQNELELLKAERFVELIKNNKFESPIIQANDFITRFKDYLRVNESELYKQYLKNGLAHKEVVLVCMRYCKEKFFSVYESLIKDDEYA